MNKPFVVEKLFLDKKRLRRISYEREEGVLAALPDAVFTQIGKPTSPPQRSYMSVFRTGRFLVLTGKIQATIQMQLACSVRSLTLMRFGAYILDVEGVASMRCDRRTSDHA